MTDNAQTAGAAGAAEGPRLTLLTQYIKDFSFENPNAPVIYAQLKGQPQITVNIDVAASKLQEKLAEVILRLRLEAKSEDKVAFVLEMEYAGLCALSGSPPPDEAERLYLVDAASLLFPFVRALVANTTRDGAFAPLLLNPIDFGQLYHQRLAARASQAAPAGTA